MVANILMVGEEEQWMAESLQATAGHSDYRVIAVQAQTATEAIHRHRPVLIIACMSGCETADLGLCRMLCNAGGVPIIAIGSPKEDTECQLAALDAGVDDYLIRPVNLQVLAARMRSLLRRRTWTPIPFEPDAPTPTLSRKGSQ